MHMLGTLKSLRLVKPQENLMFGVGRGSMIGIPQEMFSTFFHAKS